MCKLFECYLDNVDFEEDESLVFFNGDGDPMPHSRPALYMILVEHDISRIRRGEGGRHCLGSVHLDPVPCLL